MSTKKRIASRDSSSNWSSSDDHKDPKSLNASNNNNDVEDHVNNNSDHELFLQAFEKPTQIYRFLRTRQLVSPKFLFRTLSYMRHRLSRNSNRRRKDFSVDSLLKFVSEKKIKEAKEEESSGNLILRFLSINDQNVTKENVRMTLETHLIKMCHKKRKDVATPFMNYSGDQNAICLNDELTSYSYLGKCEVDVNPKEVSRECCVTIPKSQLSLSNGHLSLVKSFSLLFLATYTNHNSNNNLLSNSDEIKADERIEPPSKRRRSEEEIVCFKAELIIYDKNQRCLLTDGEYHVVLQQCKIPKSSVFQRNSKIMSWESICSEGTDGFIEEKCKQFGLMEIFRRGPVVRFALEWVTPNSEQKNHSITKSPLLSPYKSLFSLFNSNGNNENNSGIVNNMNCNNNSNSPAPLTLDPINENSTKKAIRVIYQFVYNNSTRQQTKPKNDYHCPWCSLNCIKLYSLLKHLKLCHSRFLFTYVPEVKCARIDVTINECYDGSYAGNPHDLSYSNTGFAFSRNGPVRRTPVTHVIVFRPKRSPHSLSEFLELDDDIDGAGGRTFVSGHNRLYYHTTTCLPIRPQELDYDSEGENDPEWMKYKTQLMIDEFTDVNEGEKEVMKMWNLHIMKHGFVGDCQIPLACSMFVNERGLDIIEKNLYKNFVLHVCNLFDFGLLNSSALDEIIAKLNRVKYQNERNQLTLKQESCSSA